MKKILYFDMDNVLVDFQSALPHISAELLEKHRDDPDDIPGIFSEMSPIAGALDAYATLSERFDSYILSTAPWKNPSAWSDKLNWVKTFLGQPAYKRLILTHHKNLNRGHFLIDDRENHGAREFEGELILFRSKRFPDWPTVTQYLLAKV